MKQKLKDALLEFKLLIRSVPTVITVVFIISIFAMNLLANKSIDLHVSWLALDCGIAVSWFAFLSMDVITKQFGPKASTQISILALAINLIFCLFFYLISLIPGIWGASFDAGGNVQQEVNNALDSTFGGSWYVLLGSSVAFVASAVINNFSNWGLGKLFKKNPDGACAYFLRTYVSTAVGQFADNLIFAFIVSLNFFGWTPLQCVTCALTGMLVELACEALFSYFGFTICKKMQRDNVGKEYFDFVANRKKHQIALSDDIKNNSKVSAPQNSDDISSKNPD
ncbi:MAG: VUT family protein [Corallococcus sp.]|nr:VUT family protein [Corallococcus sp.]MCM1359215.1 VUT family protein [Corallococcus sp.]MCM1394605.1 VUT family protein [Corallococcus sp.]